GRFSQLHLREVITQPKLHLFSKHHSKPVGLSFWRNRYNETRICPLPAGREQSIRYNGTAVPILYRIDYDGTACTRRFVDGEYAFRNASQFEVSQLKKYGAENAILLIQKGRSFIPRWHDYLFSEFHDPYINATEAIPTFFLYAHVFQNKIMGLVRDQRTSELELRFHRPPGGPIDLSLVIIWFLAMGCVFGGGVWAFFRHRAGKDKVHVASNSSNSQSDSSDSFEGRCRCLAKHSHYLAIIVLMIFLVGVLMVGFFFRPVLVTIFNILVVVMGPVSVYICTMAVFSNIPLCQCCTSKWCTWVPQHRWLPKGRPSMIQFLVFALSFCVCIIWFIYRRTPYAFILLDFINVTICLNILKSLRLPSVKWIAVLMICMFIYDVVMVFVTPFFTSSGCSVMLEVATGIDCSSSGTDGYPMPPIDAALPEKVS
ncbi:IntraMembrane Protease (IMPAS) family, partial [Trichostrongylus colubriformis]